MALLRSLDRVGGGEGADPAHDADALAVRRARRHLADAAGAGRGVEAVEEDRVGIRRVDDAGSVPGTGLTSAGIVGDAADGPLGAAVAGDAVGASGRARSRRCRGRASRLPLPAGGAIGAADGRECNAVRSSCCVERSELAGPKLRTFGSESGVIPSRVDVGVDGDEAAAAEDAAGVELEVLVLIAHRAPVEGAMVAVVELVEGAVERDRLARAGLERPGDGVGAAVGVARRSSRPSHGRTRTAAR